LRAPVRAALDVTGPASERISRNCLCNIFYDGFFDDLPPAFANHRPRTAGHSDRDGCIGRPGTGHP
jgi:hypothetical protein